MVVLFNIVYVINVVFQVSFFFVFSFRRQVEIVFGNFFNVVFQISFFAKQEGVFFVRSLFNQINHVFGCVFQFFRFKLGQQTAGFVRITCFYLQASQQQAGYYGSFPFAVVLFAVLYLIFFEGSSLFGLKLLEQLLSKS